MNSYQLSMTNDQSPNSYAILVHLRVVAKLTKLIHAVAKLSLHMLLGFCRNTSVKTVNIFHYKLF
jgi:hypothetical protein